MRIDISGHHVEITDGIREAVRLKLEKVHTHHPQLDAFNVILTVERHVQKAEVTCQYMGASIAVEAKNTDMYVAIADVAKKLETKLSHKRGSVKANRHKKPDLTEITEDEFDSEE